MTVKLSHSKYHLPVMISAEVEAAAGGEQNVIIGKEVKKWDLQFAAGHS